MPPPSRARCGKGSADADTVKRIPGRYRHNQTRRTYAKCTCGNRQPTNREGRALPPLDTNAAGRLGDFTTTPRVIPISLLAIGIGVLSAFVALVLLRLIGLFTNLFFFQRWSTALVSPAGNHLGVFGSSSCRWSAR